MKMQGSKKQMQGGTTADRSFNPQHDRIKENGISNAGGQRFDQTSSRNSAHKPERRKIL